MPSRASNMKKRFLALRFAIVALATTASPVQAKDDPAPAIAAPALLRPLPYKFERIAQAGPVAGVVVTVDLTDPRVRVKVALADDRDPDGDGPAVGRLDAPSNVARKQDFDLTLNASFFGAPIPKTFNGKQLRYFVGNGAYPVGWHFSNGKLISKPGNDRMRATMIIHESGRISIKDDVKVLPADTKFAVSGNAQVVTDGKVTPPLVDIARNPRSAVGICADRKTLILIAIDGRQEGHSRGVTLGELGTILQTYGASNAINLDGGGSTSMVLKDAATGVFTTVNRPSDAAAHKLPFTIERPIVDVIGVSVEALVEK
jgi:Phosphodiester glycosidase